MLCFEKAIDFKCANIPTYWQCYYEIKDVYYTQYSLNLPKRFSQIRQIVPKFGRFLNIDKTLLFANYTQMYIQMNTLGRTSACCLPVIFTVVRISRKKVNYACCTGMFCGMKSLSEYFAPRDIEKH